MKKLRVLSLVFAALFCSCKGQVDRSKSVSGKDSEFHINLEESIKASKELKISDLSNEIDYFELKMPQGEPLGTVKNVEVTEDLIFVMSKGSLYQFDHSGLLIRPIGRRGRGPGEYAAAMEINTDDAERKIYVENFLSELIYSYEGHFIDTTNNPLKGVSGDILHDGEVRYVGYELQGFSKHKLIALRGKSDTLYGIPNHEFFETKGMSFTYFIPFLSPFYRFHGDIFYKGFMDNDTIWQVNRTGYRVHAVVEMGRYKRPVPKSWDEVLKKRDEGMKGKGDYYWVNRASEDSHYIYLSCIPYFNSALKRPLLVYDKQKRQGFRVKNSHGDDGITDDLNGGAPLLPQLITENYVVSVMDAVTFLEQNENRTGLSDKLKRFIATLNENSNPVVVLGKRKKL